MKITIDEDVCTKLHMSISELLMVLLLKTGANIQDLLEKMKEKKMLIEVNTLMGNSLLISQKWSEQCDRILLTSDKSIPNKDALEKLAHDLQKVFPTGKKEGTCHYWKGNVREITLRLGKFFKLYGNKYTNDQILDAAQRYISSFNGRYQYMRILKYFIWKEDKKIDSEGNGYVEETSDLAAFIENASQENQLKEDWISNMV